MRHSKDETIRKLREQLEIEYANAEARSVLPNPYGLVGAARDRAEALREARDILGDITTSELLDAADFIGSGTRYDEDGDEIDRPVVDEWSGLYAPAGKSSQFPVFEEALRRRVEKRQAETYDSWTDLLRTAHEFGRGERLAPHIDRINTPVTDETVLKTPHSAPLVPLVGEETDRVTTTPLVPISEADIEAWNEEDEETGPLPDSTVDDGEAR